MKKNYTITIKGKDHNWSIITQAEPEHVNEWLEDGLEVYELIYSIPVWVFDLGLENVWIVVANVFNFRKPFSNLNIKDK